jgi:hypothetical protein
MKTICIAGAGTYGSYIANAIAEKYPAVKIILIETGNEQIKSETEIGFLSSLKKGAYNAATAGRYFGLGGTSARWGGQLLFLTDNDCRKDLSMVALKAVNAKYRSAVLQRFFKTVPALPEELLPEGLFIKKGIWLQFDKRNLFNFFALNTKANITIKKNCRVIQVNSAGTAVESVRLLCNGQEETVKADIFYICCGAIETMRLLAASGFYNLPETTKGFADHVSLRCFRIHSKQTTLAGHNFQYQFIGKSLITSRIIGEVEGVHFYMQPVFNERFVFFQVLKGLLIKGQFSFKQSLLALKQVFHLFPFVAEYVFKKKLYVYKDWDINIDIELDKAGNHLSLTDQKDAFGESGVAIDFEIPETTKQKIATAKQRIQQLLQDEGIAYTSLGETTSALKLEDTYHPYALYPETMPFEERYHPAANMYVLHTGLLNRAGGINPTAVLFCQAEHHIAAELPAHLNTTAS